MVGDKKYYIINSQCFRREDEINYIRSILEEENYTKVDSAKQADLIIYFTCGLGEKNVAESFINIEDIQYIKAKSAEFVVAGCLPILHQEKLNKVFQGITVTPTNYLPLNDILKKDISYDINSLSRNHKYKNMMKIFIAKGCIRNCAYCKTRLSIGKLRSKTIANILEELDNGLANNIEEFTFTADNAGDYGVDLETNIQQLLTEIDKVEKKFRFEITDLYPSAFLKYFESFKSLVASGKLTKIHLPIQTGNKRVLNLMNRHYDLEELVDRLKELKGISSVKYLFDFIIGFPTESEEEFQDTLQFIKAFSNDEFVLATYHDLPSTNAFKMDGKISDEVKIKRYEKIKELNVKIYFQLIKE